MIKIITDFATQIVRSIARSISMRWIKDSEFSSRISRVLISDPALRFYNHSVISQSIKGEVFPLAKHHEALSTQIGYCRGNNNRPGDWLLR